ncbi:hypothetical protein Ccrd_001115 [Cynara cardunculus var. scolymus]|uniref:Uncharacterized protein n=1 Tax=Cynara cardunculus var. scolymus TaxID=59895 RepID=A0A118JXX4_CYNCS|nr:hypothetical protein Ccrd_001115 [Cynara cardunculus var. scolymus]
MAIRATIAAAFGPSHLIPMLILFLLLGTTPFTGAVEQKKTMDRKQIQDCGEMVSRSQCVRTTNCRWCRSDALDDACFSKSESSRLPSHIFTC